MFGRRIVLPVLLASLPMPLLARQQAAELRLESTARPTTEVMARLSPPGEAPRQVEAALSSRKLCVAASDPSRPEVAAAVAKALDGEWRPGEKGALRLVATTRGRTQLQRSRALQQVARAAQAAALRESLQKRLSPGARDNSPEAIKDPPAWMRPTGLWPILSAIPDSGWSVIVSAVPMARSPEEPAGINKDASLVIPGAWLAGDSREALSRFLMELAAESVPPPQRLPDRYHQRVVASVRQRADGYRLAAQHPELVRMEVFGNAHPFARMPGAAHVFLDLSLLSARLPVSRDCTLALAQVPGSAPRLEAVENLFPGGFRAEHSLADRPLRGGGEFPKRLDQALIQAARLTGVSVAADYFTRGMPIPPPARDGTLGGWLKVLEERLPLAHAWVGDVLVIRSRDWAWRHDWEPPAALVDRLEARAEASQLFTLEDHLAAARCPDEQIRTLRFHTSTRGIPAFRQDAERTYAGRHVLRAYGGLTETQRAVARRPAGLSLARLSRPQLVAWEGLLQRFALLPRGAWPRIAVRLSPSDDPPIPGVELSVPGLGVVPAGFNPEHYRQRLFLDQRRPEPE